MLPHLVLLGFSVLAISWSLMWLGFGVSDDAFGAGTAIFWTIYNAGLMTLVVAIGSRPAEKRAACRFKAHFAVEGTSRGSEAGRIGITADIAEHGCSLLWPSPVEVGRRIPVRVHLGPHTAEWTAEVMSRQGQVDGWHRLGVRFVDLTPRDIDLINDTVFAIVVPDFFSTLVEPSWLAGQLRRLRSAAVQRLARRPPRRSAPVPVRVQHAAGAFVTTMRDLSTTGLAVQSPVPLEPGTTVEVTLTAPGRRFHGPATVVRADARPSRLGFSTWIVALHFTQEQARETVAPFQFGEAA